MRLRRGAVVLALASAACAGPLERRTRDPGPAGELLAERAGAVPDLAEPDGGGIAEETAALLAGGLTEEVAVRVALSNNRAVRHAFAELGVAAAEAARAALVPNPTFGGDAKFFDGGTEIELSLVQPILDAMLVPLRRELADARYEEAKARVARELVALVHEVRRAFAGVLAAERLVGARRDALAAAEASHDLMADLHRAGNVTDSELAAEEVGLGRAKLGLARAEAALSEAREPLNVLLGLWGPATAWRLEAELADDVLDGLDLDAVESRAVAASLDLSENRIRAEAHASALGLSSWEGWLPGAELGVAAKREASDGSFGLGPAIGLDLPLFDRGRTRAREREARLQAALARHVTLAVEVRAAARLLRERVLALAERARYLREEHLPAHDRYVRRTLRDYNAMQIGAFDVLAVRQLEVGAETAYVETLRDAWIARIDLEELLEGRLDPARLSAPALPSIDSERSR